MASLPMHVPVRYLYLSLFLYHCGLLCGNCVYVVPSIYRDTVQVIHREVINCERVCGLL